MTMRCRVVRQWEDTKEEQYNLKSTSDRVIYESLPCYAFIQQSRQQVDQNRFVYINTFRVMVPRDADIENQDEITLVSDRASKTLITTNTLRVATSPVLRESFQELSMEAVV